MCNFACCCVSGNAVFYKLEQTSLDTGYPSFPYFGIMVLNTSDSLYCEVVLIADDIWVNFYVFHLFLF